MEELLKEFPGEMLTTVPLHLEMWHPGIHAPGMWEVRKERGGDDEVPLSVLQGKMASSDQPARGTVVGPRGEGNCGSAAGT